MKFDFMQLYRIDHNGIIMALCLPEKKPLVKFFSFWRTRKNCWGGEEGGEQFPG